MYFAAQLCDANFNFVVLHIVVPSPNVMLMVPDIQAVGQSLSLECIVTTVRGLSSSIDIIWTSDGVEINRTSGASIGSETSSSILYRDFYNISLLTTAEDGRAYQCEGVINTTPNLTAESSTTLDVIGTYVTNYCLLYLFIDTIVVL